MPSRKNIPYKQAIANRKDEIDAAKAIIESRFRLNQVGVTRNKNGRYIRVQKLKKE